MTTVAEEKEARLAALNEKLAKNNIQGYWQSSHGRETVIEPHLWSWEGIYDCVQDSCQLVTIGAGGDTFRRAHGLRHPTLGQASPSLTMGVQAVNPGETALAHRHVAAALRFVIQSDGGSTTSDGDQMVMEEGDLLIQPNWTWHDHANAGKKPVLWLDILDAHIVRLFGANFHENFSEDTQPSSKPANFSNDHYGVVRSVGETITDPPFHYRWSETSRALEAAAAQGPTSAFDGTMLSYKNPVTGGPTFRTMDCRIQLLQPGEETKSHRHTGTTLYHVFKGSGETTVEDNTLNWNDKDCFMLPTWRWHKHRNASKSEPAILFSVTDRPSLEAFNFYREEGDDTK